MSNALVDLDNLFAQFQGGNAPAQASSYQMPSGNDLYQNAVSRYTSGQGYGSSDISMANKQAVYQDRIRALQGINNGLSQMANSLQGMGGEYSMPFPHPYAGPATQARPDYPSQLMMLLEALNKLGVQ